MNVIRSSQLPIDTSPEADEAEALRSAEVAQPIPVVARADWLTAENINRVPEFAEKARRRSIMGCVVHDLSWPEALSMTAGLADMRAGQARIAFLNANNANILQSDPQYRSVLAEQIVLPDGVGIDIACLVLHGSKFSANLNGTDFVPALTTYIARRKRIGLVGGRPEVLTQAVARFKAHAPWHDFIAISDGYFDTAASGAVVDKIAAARLDILLVGMGTPLQEKWVAAHLKPEHARLVLCVGALFDFVSGTVPRAPVLVRRLRLEWIYRMVMEPRRLWRRYILGGPSFLFQLARHKLFPRLRLRG